jgi:hypothetical protein
MFPRQPERGIGIARQQCGEGCDPLGVERKIRRQLPQDRSEFATQAQQARGEEVRHRYLYPAQP